MPSPDDTLAAIDDVITWHGSDDAMVWTADEPKQVRFVTAPQLAISEESLARMADALTPMAEAVREMTRQIGQAYLNAAQQLMASPGVRQLVDFADSPEGRAYIEAAERGELEPAPPSCHCLCVATHRDRMGVCEGDAVDELVRVSPSVGRVHIPVCGPCWDAQMAEAR